MRDLQTDVCLSCTRHSADKYQFASLLNMGVSYFLNYRLERFAGNIIDTLDAITSDRPYRRAQNFDRAAEEIVSAAGSQFDPLAVEVFVAEKAALRRMVDLKCTMSEAEVDTTLNLDARTKP